MSKVFYAICITPECTLPFSAGYKYMAAKLRWNEKKRKLEYEQASDFFKTVEEAEKFAEEHPEYRPASEICEELREEVSTWKRS